MGCYAALLPKTKRFLMLIAEKKGENFYIQVQNPRIERKRERERERERLIPLKCNGKREIKASFCNGRSYPQTYSYLTTSS